MRLEDLLKPITPDEPCGPDLEATGDEAFFDYYDLAVERLPAVYFNVARGTVFDPRSINAKAETAQIDLLLARSRDIRFLVLEAKFQILATRLKGFADAVLAIAEVLEAWPQDVHPRSDADNSARRNALEELDVLATVVTPLEYAPLLTDRRIGDVLFRAFLTGSGKAALRDGEEPRDADAVVGALAGSDNAKAVETLHDLLGALIRSLERITAVCRAGPKPFTPRFDRLEKRLSEMRSLVLTARPDLGPDAGGGQAAPGRSGATETTEAPTATQGNAAAEGGGQAVEAYAATALPDHATARALLAEAERYFARMEPSALALILVTQARLLIGRPLVEALDALLESAAERAVIDLGSETGFSIAMPRMRHLSEAAGLGTDGEGGEDRQGAEDGPPPRPAAISSRDHAAQALKQVEEFFRQREPASPVPILLFKARSALNKDFHALIRELLPKDPD
jgi:type VI secretion system protein ImpA